MNNFRPISLLSKVMEKLLHKRLYDFLEKNYLTEKIGESIDKGKYGCGIFIDLRKAFDT